MSRALLERICKELQDSGNWMSFARYMELVLYEPGLGYYASGAVTKSPPAPSLRAPEA